MMWSKVKSILRKIKATTVDGLNEAIKIVLESVTQCDARGLFKKTGYEA